MAVLFILLVGFVIAALFLLVKYAREMRDIVRESRLEIKELNANIKTLKCRFNDLTDSAT